MTHPNMGQQSARVTSDTLAALERARVVAVLDGWSSRTPGRSWTMTPSGACELHDNGGPVHRWHIGGSNDAARTAAAKAIEAGEV